MMQLERIRVDGLFGRFNHDIALRKSEKITIIHAPNGFGKTVVLTLVNSFFNRQFWSLFRYQFQSLTLYFDNHESVEIRNDGLPDLFLDKGREARERREVVISLNSPNAKTEPFRLKMIEELPQLNRYLPFIEPLGLDTWMDENTDEVLSTSEVLERYGAGLPPQLRKAAFELPEWLSPFVDRSDCRLIETQRLLRITRPAETGRPRRTAPTRPVVEVEARDLAGRIGRTLAEYANRAQTLDQSFPRRVLDALRSTDAPLPEDVLARLQDVGKKRSALIETGLLDQTGAPEILSEAELQGQQVRQVIGVYLSDVERKFSRFDELFDRVSLFKEIISEKFQFKSVLVSREKGISVKTEDGAEIGLTDLSSGEQHELVLLYELLFGVRDGALILIDEPELSLHVGWQVRFLPDLQRIQQLKPLQIIIATHSPQIINDRWDLTVELKH